MIIFDSHGFIESTRNTKLLAEFFELSDRNTYDFLILKLRQQKYPPQSSLQLVYFQIFTV